MSVTTIEKSISRVEQAAKACYEKNRQPMILDASDRIGTAVRQGDVYLRVVPNDYPRGEETPQRQLAPGTTRGSRHVVDSVPDVYSAPDKFPVIQGEPSGFVRVLHGPVLVLTAGEEAVVDHPEHRPAILKGPLVCRVEYQRDFTSEVIRRVED